MVNSRFVRSQIAASLTSSNNFVTSQTAQLFLGWVFGNTVPGCLRGKLSAAKDTSMRLDRMVRYGPSVLHAWWSCIFHRTWRCCTRGTCIAAVLLEYGSPRGDIAGKWADRDEPTTLWLRANCSSNEFSRILYSWLNACCMPFVVMSSSHHHKS